MVDHLLRDVRVQVERNRDRRIGQRRAHAREQIALAVRALLGDHCAMQVEHHRVAARCGRNDRVADRRIRVGRDRAARVRCRRHRRRDLGARTPGRIEERSHCGAHPAVRAIRVVAQVGAVPAERRQRRSHRREGVRLVVHPGDQNLHCASPCVEPVVPFVSRYSGANFARTARSTSAWAADAQRGPTGGGIDHVDQPRVDGIEPLSVNIGLL